MKYLGGKSRFAKQISEIINCFTKDKTFISLFCGSCVIESKIISENKICNDKHEYLIAMWKGLQNCWKPPNVITKDDYDYIRKNKDENKALTGFVGFGCSFGGKWFGGFAKGSTKRNYCDEAKRHTIKTFEGLKKVDFYCRDYKDILIPENAVIYCDPPYENTTGYSVGEFNHIDFWEYIRNLSQTNLIFVSEENAPEDFVCVWKKQCQRSLDVNKENKIIKFEKLFIHKNNLDLFNKNTLNLIK